MIATAIAVSVLIGAATAAPSTSPSIPAVTWQGVTVGEATATVVARLGAPASRHRAIRGAFLLDYTALGGVATLTLTDSDGIVTGVRLSVPASSTLRRPVSDPFGVALGDSGDRLSELRGPPQRYDDEGGGEFRSYYGKPSDVRWAYGLVDNVVWSIGIVLPYRIVRATGAAAIAIETPRPANAPTPPPSDASSYDRAVKVTADDVAADPQFEFTYVGAIACGSGDRWSPVGETVINAKRRNFSRVDAVCKSTTELRSFYFDITAVFGRADR